MANGAFKVLVQCCWQRHTVINICSNKKLRCPFQVRDWRKQSKATGARQKKEAKALKKKKKEHKKRKKEEKREKKKQEKANKRLLRGGVASPASTPGSPTVLSGHGTDKEESDSEPEKPLGLRSAIQV